MPVRSRAGEPFSWSRDAQAHPWIAECHRRDIGCYFVVSATTEENGEVALALHTCPHRGGPTKIGLMVKVTLLEEVWEMLDEVVDKIMDPDTDDSEKHDLQQQAKAYAKVICLFMQIYFEFPHEVSAEAKRRWEARQRGDETYCTKGLGSRATEFPEPGFREKTEQQKQLSGAQQRSRTKAPAKASVGDQEKQAIKFAAESGMFTKDQIAKTYKITVAQVDEILAGS